MLTKDPTDGRPGSGAPTIDMGSLIRQASTRVRLEQLSRKGMKFVALLSREKIEELVNQAVKTILEKYSVTGISGKKLQAESQAEFKELFQQYQDAEKAKSELEASRSALDEELEALQDDLEVQKAREEARLADAEARKAAFEVFGKDLDEAVKQAFERRRVLLQDPDNPETKAELERLEELLRPMVRRLAQGEWDRFERSQGGPKELQVLERRIKKLMAHIAALEGALRTISNSKLYSNQQIQNLLRDLGLLNSDKFFEKKKEMLKIVLSANLDLRKQAKTLEDQGITLSSPKGNGTHQPAVAS